MANEEDTLNCLDSFLALFRGTSPDAQINDLIEYMVKSSYFFSQESVNARYKKMLNLLFQYNSNNDVGEYDLNAEKSGYLYCRYSTVKGENSPYYSDTKGLKIADDDKSSKSKIIEYQKKNDVYYKSSRDSYIKVKIDNDGNAAVRRLITKVSGYKVSEGAKSTIKNATISHIWRNASNPLYFTSLWNIVIVPTFCNFILDKNEIKSENANEIEDDKFQKIINRVNLIFKAICWELYDVKEKQFGGLIEIDKPSDEDLELAKSYISLIPKDHFLRETK